MTGLDRLAGGPRGPLLPDFERASSFIGDTDTAPQGQKRALNRLACSAIDFVIHEVREAAGPIVLAMCMNAQRIGYCCPVVIERASIEGRQVAGFGPARHLPVEEFDRRF